MMKASSIAACPVPTEQQPINEYKGLKESACFRHAALGLRHYLMIITWVWSLGWLLCSPLAAGSFSLTRQPARLFLSSAAGASFVLLLVLLRFYLGWTYIYNRLSNTTIVYEESGWYDGQSWTKPEEILLRDRLVATYQIQPILYRLKLTFALLALAVCGGILIWMLL